MYPYVTCIALRFDRELHLFTLLDWEWFIKYYDLEEFLKYYREYYNEFIPNDAIFPIKSFKIQYDSFI